jgi:hypothetical protein
VTNRVYLLSQLKKLKNKDLGSCIENNLKTVWYKKEAENPITYLTQRIQFKQKKKKKKTKKKKRNKT